MIKIQSIPTPALSGSGAEQSSWVSSQLTKKLAPRCVFKVDDFFDITKGFYTKLNKC